MLQVRQLTLKKIEELVWRPKLVNKWLSRDSHPHVWLQSPASNNTPLPLGAYFVGGIIPSRVTGFKTYGSELGSSAGELGQIQQLSCRKNDTREQGVPGRRNGIRSLAPKQLEFTLAQMECLWRVWLRLTLTARLRSLNFMESWYEK